MEDKEKVEYENRRVLYRMIVNSFGNEKIFLIDCHWPAVSYIHLL